MITGVYSGEGVGRTKHQTGLYTGRVCLKYPNKWYSVMCGKYRRECSSRRFARKWRVKMSSENSHSSPPPSWNTEYATGLYTLGVYWMHIYLIEVNFCMATFCLQCLLYLICCLWQWIVWIDICASIYFLWFADLSQKFILISKIQR